jgi:protocatechuate 3,4-dioxygenase beta subunit
MNAPTLPDESGITRAFLDACGPATPPRLRQVLERLVHHLHAFARETGLTHAEWRKGMELLSRAGRITTDERNEFVLFSDVLGLSSLIDMLHSPPGATPSSVLGPFHIRGAPLLPWGSDLKQGNEGATLFVQGRVLGADGQPLRHAQMEVWQTALNGLYSNQDPAQSEWNLRARLQADGDGRYAFSTVAPAPYTVPNDGPVGDLLGATGRHPWRPSHLHFIIEAPGHRTLVTELFPASDPYLYEDAVFGVRAALVYRPRRLHDTKLAPQGLERSSDPGTPFDVIDFDFTLHAVAP